MWGVESDVSPRIPFLLRFGRFARVRHLRKLMGNPDQSRADSPVVRALAGGFDLLDDRRVKLDHLEEPVARGLS